MPDVRMMEREWTDRLTAFTSELRALTEVLDPSAGWFAAFNRRNGGELTAWLTGGALPPWDAVADLVQDLAVLRGTVAAEGVARRLRSRYEAAVAAGDALPGGREALSALLAELDRAAGELEGRLRMLAHAGESARRAGQRAEAERLAALAEWARDDQERVLTRRSEAHARLAAITGRGHAAPRPPAGAGTAPPGTARPGAGQRAGASTGPSTGSGAAAGPATADPGAPNRGAAPNRGTAADRGAGGRGAGHPETVTPETGEGARAAPPRRREKPARRPRGGARFAGIEPSVEEPPEAAATAEAATAEPDPTPAMDLPTPHPPPSGSRFAGALRDHRPTLAERVTARDREETARTAGRLRDLWARGQNGTAHGVLSEVVVGPAVRLPLLLAELERAGLGSEKTTLLWEAASLPPGPLAAAAEALSLAGREEDCGQLLRQGAARPAAEVGSVAAELRACGLADEAVLLLRALVQARTAEEAAQAVSPAPDVLVPILLAAAREVSPRHHWAVTSELRRAGVA